MFYLLTAVHSSASDCAQFCIDPVAYFCQHGNLAHRLSHDLTYSMTGRACSAYHACTQNMLRGVPYVHGKEMSLYM